MATREEMIAASKARFGESWEPLDLSTPEAARRTYGEYWDTSCWNPESGCSVHTREIDRLSAIRDEMLRKTPDQGGINAANASTDEWLRMAVDNATITRKYAQARQAATEKWAASAAPDQMRTVALCRETNRGWFEYADRLDADAAEIEAGLNSGRFKRSRSCGSVKRVGGVPIATDSASVIQAAVAAILFLLIASFLKG